METEVTCPYCRATFKQKFVPRYSGKARLVFCQPNAGGCGRPFMAVPTFDLTVDVSGIVINRNLLEEAHV